MLPAPCAFRALLALKLWGIGRPSRALAEVFDHGLALFAGLNAFPKRATLTEYSCRVDPRTVPDLMRAWADAAHQAGLPRGNSFDLDFHTIPYHGDDALAEKHYVAKRSRRQKGILAFLARDAEARLFCYANGTLRKHTQNDEILRFAEDWQQRTAAWPGELVFDSKLTTYSNLARLDQLGIHFITLRRRGPKLLAAIAAEPRTAWQRITLHNVGPRLPEPAHPRPANHPEGLSRPHPPDRRHRSRPRQAHPAAHQPDARNADPAGRPLCPAHADRERHRPRDRPLPHGCAVRRGAGSKSTSISSSPSWPPPCTACSPTGLAKAISTRRPGRCSASSVHASADLTIDEHTITVQFGRRANNPFLVKQRFGEEQCRIPWLGNRLLRFAFDTNGKQNVTS